MSGKPGSADDRQLAVGLTVDFDGAYEEGGDIYYTLTMHPMPELRIFSPFHATFGV